MITVERNTTSPPRRYRKHDALSSSEHSDVLGARQTIWPAIREVDRLQELTPGWGGENWLAPDPDAILAARDWLLRLWSQQEASMPLWIPPHVTASPQGDVVLEWWRGAKKLTVYISSRSAEYLKVWGTNIFEDMEDGVADSPSDLLEWLQSN